MLRTFLAAAAATILLSAASAQAADMTKVACSGFVKMIEDDKHDIALDMIAWYDGYFSAEEDSTEISGDEVALLIERTAQECQKDPKQPLMKAVKRHIKAAFAATDNNPDSTMDLGTISCADMKEINDKQFSRIFIAFTEGYFSWQLDDTSMSAEEAKEVLSHLKAFCKKSPNKPMIAGLQKRMVE